MSVQSLSTGDAVWSTRLPVGETTGDTFRRSTLVVAGGVVVATETGSQSRLRRLGVADGAIQTSFGGSGALTLPASFGRVGDIAQLAGGRIGVVSAGSSDAGGPNSVRTIRLSPSGAVDPTFPTVVTPVGGPLLRSALAGAPDAGILVTTSTETTGVLRRYVGGAPPATSALAPLQPGRLLDTRDPGGTTVDGQFQAQGTRPAEGELALQVAGRGEVPSDAAAVVLNVTVTGAQGAGFVTAWPCDEPRPNASSLNFVEGQTVPNAVVVKLSLAGTVCLYNAQAATDLLADVNGYFPAGSGFEPLQPGRVLDTRNPGGSTADGQFQAQGAPAADTETQLVVSGRSGVPEDAAAVVLNVTVVGAQGAGFVTVWPCGEPRPDASSLNFVEGQTVPNAVVAKVGAGGAVCLYNAQAATDLLADVNGYFQADSGYESLQPGRLLDTRNPGGSTADGQFQAEGTRPADAELQLQVAGRSGVPEGASAAVLNITVTGAQGAGFITAWPCDEPRPNASSLNFVEGQTVPNAVVVKLLAAGAVCLYNAQAATDLLADVNGYFP
ncbi:hypothetical protein BH23ACT3_BH23ACT3_12990 [soil metagenome]